MSKKTIFLSLVLFVLAGCDDENSQQESSGSSDPNAVPAQAANGCPPSSPLGDASYTSGTVSAKIDTDGDPSMKGSDATWQAQTNAGVNSAKAAFVVMSPTQMAQSGVSIGDWAKVTNTATGQTTWAIVGDKGPSGGAGEISELAAHNVGIQFTSNSSTIGDPQVNVQSFGGTSSIQANCDAVASNS